MTNIIWGVSGGFHDASLCVVKNNELVFASSTERYSRIKNDKNFNFEIIDDALKYGYPHKIVWYENYFKRFLRNVLYDRKLPFVPNIKEFNFFKSKFNYCNHHESHLCSSLYTAPFETKDTLGVVIDSVGEFNTTSFWKVDGLKYKQIASKRYPNSLGVFYSSITQLLGLKPQEEEYIMMGMSSYGKEERYYQFFKNNFFDSYYNLVFDLRKGCKKLFSQDVIEQDKFNIALGAQKIYEEALIYFVKKYLNITKAKNLILSGGCMLNCVANTKLLELVDNIWLFPNTGDSGSAVGAALSVLKQKIKVKNIFLGHDVGEIKDIKNIVNTLYTDHVVGVMNGKAEFGPRALGNRSILADPRIKNIKTLVNNIKGREQFRPFAAVVLEEYAKDIFDMGIESSPYMSYVFKCKVAELYPSIIHVDKTSRLQTVSKQDGFIYNVLKEWYAKTKCPLLLNTSLNIKGKPLLNKLEDIKEFSNLKIITPLT